MTALDDIAQRALRDADAEQARKKRFQRDYRKQFRVRRFAGPLVHQTQLDHLRIAHVTDIHVGRVTPFEAQMEAVRLVRRTLHKADAEVLDNVHTTITLRHQKLQVLGLDDTYTGHGDWRKATKGLRHDLPVLGLSHIAEEADALWTQGVPLVLSGHTHAGQITIAKLHELAVGKLAGHKYIHGLYGSREAERDSKLGAVYVGAGVGAAVVPLRLGERARREVTFFELGHAAGSFLEHHAEQPALPGRKPSEKTKERRMRAVAKKRQKREKKRARLARKTGDIPPQDD